LNRPSFQTAQHFCRHQRAIIHRDIASRSFAMKVSIPSQGVALRAPRRLTFLYLEPRARGRSSRIRSSCFMAWARCGAGAQLPRTPVASLPARPVVPRRRWPDVRAHPRSDPRRSACVNRTIILGRRASGPAPGKPRSGRARREGGKRVGPRRRAAEAKEPPAGDQRLRSAKVPDVAAGLLVTVASHLPPTPQDPTTEPGPRQGRSSVGRSTLTGARTRRNRGWGRRQTGCEPRTATTTTECKTW
jgi:hypothetical protein